MEVVAGRGGVLFNLQESGAGVRRLHRPHLRLRQRRRCGHVRGGLRRDRGRDAERERRFGSTRTSVCPAVVNRVLL